MIAAATRTEAFARNAATLWSEHFGRSMATTLPQEREATKGLIPYWKTQVLTRSPIICGGTSSRRRSRGDS
jgi:hypothetical protein